MQETWVLSLSREDTLEKGMATHSSILAWRIPWTEDPGRLQSMESQESDMTEWLTLTHIHIKETEKEREMNSLSQETKMTSTPTKVHEHFKRPFYFSYSKEIIVDKM